MEDFFQAYIINTCSHFSKMVLRLVFYQPWKKGLQIDIWEQVKHLQL